MFPSDSGNPRFELSLVHTRKVLPGIDSKSKWTELSYGNLKLFRRQRGLGLKWVWKNAYWYRPLWYACFDIKQLLLQLIFSGRKADIDMGERHLHFAIYPYGSSSHYVIFKNTIRM